MTANDPDLGIRNRVAADSDILFEVQVGCGNLRREHLRKRQTSQKSNCDSKIPELACLAPIIPPQLKMVELLRRPYFRSRRA